MNQRVTPQTLTTVIYHSPCYDGLGAAYISARFAGSPTRYGYIGLRPQDPAPRGLQGKVVLVVDISWSRSEMERMYEETGGMLLVLDHHKTAQENLQGLPFAQFDMNRSGITMAWDFFYPHDQIPDWLRYLSMRDLWKHKEDPAAEAFCAAFDVEQTIQAFNGFEGAASQNTRVLITKGRAILEYQRSVIQTMAQRATEHLLRLPDGAEYQVRLVNAPYPWNSDLGAFLCEAPEHQHKVAIIWSKVAGEPISCSLRSHDKAGPDVTPIARAFGGGGHAHAAAFRSDKLVEEIF